MKKLFILVCSTVMFACTDEAEPARDRTDHTEVEQPDTSGKPLLDSTTMMQEKQAQ